MGSVENVLDPRASRPNAPVVAVDGRTLHVAWPDGHVSNYPLAELRRRCTCPTCRSQPRAVSATVAVTRVCLVLSAITLVAGILLIGADTESVVVTGPVLLVISTVMGVAGYRSGYPRVVTFALCHAGVEALLFTLVVVNNWSPRSAQAPFVAILIPYTLATIAAQGYAFLHPPAVEPEPTWNCQTCGYLLYGLKEDRCPECGEAFDRAQLPPTPPAGALESATA